MNWKDIFKFPFMVDEYCGNIIAQPDDSGYTRVWDWIENDWICEYPINNHKGAQLADAIVRYLNGQTEYRPDYTWSLSPNDCTVVQMNGQDCLDIRGWSNICGVVGDHKVAAKIQDEFIQWLIDKLNGKI